MPQKSKFTEEFKKEAVRLALMGGQTQGKIAQEAGISLSELKRWIRKYRDEVIAWWPDLVVNEDSAADFIIFRNSAAQIERLHRRMADLIAELERSCREIEDMAGIIKNRAAEVVLAKKEDYEIRQERETYKNALIILARKTPLEGRISDSTLCSGRHSGR
jgi:transposase-like protein